MIETKLKETPNNIDRIPTNLEFKVFFSLIGLGGIITFISFIIIYIYVPSFDGFIVSGHPVFYMISQAFTAFTLFALAFISSIMFLWKKSLIFDAIAVASAKTGILACTLTLGIGILWSKVEWGYYWQWEARQTMTLIMFIFYVGMLLFRSTVEDINDKAKLTAVFGITAFPTVPMTNFIVGGLHPQPQQTAMGGNTFLAVIVIFIGTLCFYMALLYLVILLEQMTQKMDAFKYYILSEKQN
jgi:heme exporter protein C